MKQALAVFELRFNYRTHSGLLAENDNFKTAEVWELLSGYNTIWSKVFWKPLFWTWSK